MSKHRILDCTLRDGGYINNWMFGFNHIKQIIHNLTESNIDFIECGYLSNKQSYNKNQTIFDNISRINELAPKNKKYSNYVCMINYGEYELEKIPEYNENFMINGIRLVFHKNQMEEALEFCFELKKKGYLIFVQPMVTINYTVQELLFMIQKVNEISPYAFYLVDSFGVMKKNDLIRLFYLVDHNLNEGIHLGYHGHNNLQLAYSNSQAFVEIDSTRTRIIDSSIYGMGRGAGNLNTELFVQYLNDKFNLVYDVNPLLNVIDDTLNNIYVEHYWGYSLPHYLSANFNCHPNYATYLAEKNTLSVKAIQEVLSSIPIEKRDSFNRNYVEELYIQFQKRQVDDASARKELKEYLSKENVLIVAPGKTLKEYNEKILKFIDQFNPKCISVNFVPNKIKCDYTFISNIKRLQRLEIDNVESTIIVTSNINIDSSNTLKVNYADLLIKQEAASDNATLMLLQLLKSIGIQKVFLVGYDGYEYNHYQNYVDKDLMVNISNQKLDEINIGISKVINEMKSDIDIEFLTPSKYTEE